MTYIKSIVLIMWHCFTLSDGCKSLKLWLNKQIRLSLTKMSGRKRSQRSKPVKKNEHTSLWVSEDGLPPELTMSNTTQEEEADEDCNNTDTVLGFHSCNINRVRFDVNATELVHICLVLFIFKGKKVLSRFLFIFFSS